MESAPGSGGKPPRIPTAGSGNPPTGGPFRTAPLYFQPFRAGRPGLTPPPPETNMHYPHRTSRIKRKRSIGFRARMKTKNGRKMLNRKRRVGRSLNVADK